MFENIIGQKPVVATLLASIASGSLPRAMLFYGPQYSGKLSTALELARVLTCEEGKGDWRCECGSCRKQRLLFHPNVLLLGARDFDSEILASADVLERTGKQSARFLFIRACRKLLRRFDALLWEGDDTKVRQFASSISELEELLDTISRKNDAPQKTIKKIVDLGTKIQAALKTDNIPIHHVRKAIAWAHMAAGNSRKIIIIENADKMLESSRNSLLKLLEEPPESVYIILLTARKDAVIKTILSRLRAFCFSDRTAEENSEILGRIFQEDQPEFASLRDYFLAWKNVNPPLMKTLSSKFIELLLADINTESDISGEMEDLFSSRQDRTVFSTFAEELFLRLEEMILVPGCPFERIKLIDRWSGLIRETVSSIETFNLSPKNVLVSLFYRMREIV